MVLLLRDHLDEVLHPLVEGYGAVLVVTTLLELDGGRSEVDAVDARVKIPFEDVVDLFLRCGTAASPAIVTIRLR